MKGIKVQWTEYVSLPESLWDDYVKHGKPGDLSQNIEGEVLGVTSGILSGKELIVACTDGKIRSVSIHRVTIINDLKSE